MSGTLAGTRCAGSERLWPPPVLLLLLARPKVLRAALGALEMLMLLSMSLATPAPASPPA